MREDPLHVAELIDQVLAGLGRSETNRRAAVGLAREVAPQGFRLLAFKGLHLAYTIAEHPIQRPSHDADLWVARGRYPDLVAYLRRSKRYRVRPGPFATILETEAGARLDLQRYLWPPPFHVRDAALVRDEAGTTNRLGPDLFVPSLTAAGVIALTHFVKDALGAFGSSRASEDLRRLESAGLDPADLGARLREHGLLTTGVVAATVLAEEDPRFSEWVRAFDPPPFVRRAAHSGERALRRVRQDRRAGFLVVPSLLRDRLGDRLMGSALAVVREARGVVRQWRS